MPFSAKTNQVGARLSQLADKAAGEPLNVSVEDLATMFRKMEAGVDEIVAEIDPDSVVPQELADAGVCQAAWDRAVSCKAMAAKHQSKKKGSFTPLAIKRMAVEISKTEHMKPKACRPMAIAAMQTAMQSTEEELARAIQDTMNTD